MKGRASSVPVVLLVACLLFPSVPLPPAQARELTTFSNGQASAIIEVAVPGGNSELSLAVPENCHVTDARFTVSTHGGGDPRSPLDLTLNIDDDLEPEWAFAGPGVGAFGSQDRASDGSAKLSLAVPSGSSTFYIRLPKGCQVSRATFNITGVLDDISWKPVSQHGARVGDTYGFSLAGGTDINADGFPDIVVGAPMADQLLRPDTGLAAVHYGGPSGIDGTRVNTIFGNNTGDAFGFSVGSSKDSVGKDGCGEILVGAVNATDRAPGPGPTPSVQAGVAYLFAYDPSSGRIRQMPVRAVPGETPGGWMGAAVSEIGDVDGDGRNDVAMSELHWNNSLLVPEVPDAGRVVILRSSDIGGKPVQAASDRPSQYFGYCLASGRDLDGDGKADFVTGAPLFGNPLPVGAAFVYYSRRNFQNPQVLAGGQLNAMFGSSACLGDFDGDGNVDLAVGAPNASFSGTAKEVGAAFIFHGGPAGINESTGRWARWGRWPNGGYGTRLACPGDLDFDGTDDLAVGAPDANNTAGDRTGAVEIFLTGRNLTLALQGAGRGELYGMSVARTGDINGDGFLDLAAGAPLASDGGLLFRGRVDALLTSVKGTNGLRVQVTGNGSEDLNIPGIFTGTRRLGDLSAKLNGYLSNDLPTVADDFGNEFIDVPVVVKLARPGSVIISDIAITYNWTATVERYPPYWAGHGNLTNTLNSLLNHRQTDPPVKEIPLPFTARTPGRIAVSDLYIRIDEAPVIGTVPVLELPEDTSDDALLDLRTVFSDDYETEAMEFHIDYYTNDTLMNLTLREGRWLSADAQNGTLNDNWTGEVLITVTATDLLGLWNSTELRLMVTPENDPPLITSQPALNATAGVRYSYQLAAVDAENDSLSFSVLSDAGGMTVNSTSGLVEWTPGGTHFGRSFNVTAGASDGRLAGTQQYRLTVDRRLAGVQVSGNPPPAAVAGEDYYYRPDLSTDVAGAAPVLGLVSGPTGMTVLGNGSLHWVPATGQLGVHEVIIEASDGYFTARQAWNVTALPGGTPPSGIACTVLYPAEGEKVSGKVTVRGRASVVSGSVMNVEVAVDRGRWKPAEGTLSWNFTLDTRSLSNGRHEIHVRAFDGQAHSLNATVAVDVDNPARAGAGAQAGAGALLLLFLIVAAAAGAGLYLRKRRARPAPTPLSAPAGAEGEFAVEDVFLIHLDGRLIHHSTRRLATGVDTDILTSMLTAVTSFVKDALARTEDGTLGSLEFGNNKIVLERGRNVYLAVVIAGRSEPPELREEMRQALKNIEGEFSGVLPSWDGNAASLAGAKRLLAPVTAFAPAPAAPAEPPRPGAVDVSLAAELEFYQGYVRIKVAVKNSSPSFIMDSSLKLIYNDKALRLERIEPEYPLSGREIMLGNIGIKEKKTVALYLDPQICMESYIEGTLTFKDAQGELHHENLKKKLASVVCPIMHTDENVNLAMLRRMLEDELDQKDSKLFTLPPGLEPEKGFELCKRAVQGHDIRMVREFSEERPAFVGEAWYFGKVKGRQDRLVVKAAVRADTSSAEFHVASNSRLVVTGLLAELKNDLNREYKKEKGADRQVEALTDASRRERVQKEGTLLSKHGEAEPPAGGAQVRFGP